MKKIFAVVLASAAIGLAGCATSSTESSAPAASATPPAPTVSAADVITQRQNAMRQIGGAARGLQGGGDLAALQASARTIATSAQQLSSLFPAGSGPESGVETRALASIWTNRAAFDQQLAALVTAAQATANATTPEAAATASRGIGATCGSCHSQFRAPT